MNAILTRLKQPTTWAGLVSIITAFGVTLNPELIEGITAAGASLAGLLLVIFNEDK